MKKRKAEENEERKQGRMESIKENRKKAENEWVRAGRREK